MAPRNYNDARDRSVPPEEDYYGKVPVDLNFNSRESRNSFEDEAGINPAEEYNKYYREQEQRRTQSGTGEIPIQRKTEDKHSYRNAPQRQTYSRDDLRYSPDRPPRANEKSCAQGAHRYFGSGSCDCDCRSGDGGIRFRQSKL